jgi:hypothetical protein
MNAGLSSVPMTNATCHPERPDVGGGDCADCVLEGIDDMSWEMMDGPQGKVCSSCGEKRPDTDFHKNQTTCKACVRLRRYGLTHAGYEILLEEQDRQCAVCSAREEEVVFAVDHDHATGVVRGLLCGPCNRALGLLRDDPELVRRAAEYLTMPPTAGSFEFNLGGCGCFPSQPRWTVGQVERTG